MNPRELIATRRLEDTHWWHRGMRAISRALLATGAPELAPRLAAGALILDVGCGAGGWLKAVASGMVAPAWRGIGIDLMPLAARLTRERGVPAVVGSAAALPFHDGAFALVTCFDVISEAVATVPAGRMVGELARVTSPGGVLLLRVPAHEWLRGSHDAAVATARRFEAGEVRALLNGSGLEVVRLTHANLLLLPAAIIRRRVARSRVPRSDLEAAPAWLNQLLEGLLLLEAALLRRHDLPSGLSLVALARKPAAVLVEGGRRGQTAHFQRNTRRRGLRAIGRLAILSLAPRRAGEREHGPGRGRGPSQAQSEGEPGAAEGRSLGGARSAGQATGWRV